jgi:hypothetical protein
MLRPAGIWRLPTAPALPRSASPPALRPSETGRLPVAQN